MTTIIYADSLIAVNFSMDLLSLFLCSKLMRFPIRPKRLAFSATVGALYSLLAVTASTFVHLGVIEYILTAVCAYVMTLIAFRGNAAANIKTTTAYLAVNISLGGLMTVLFTAMTKISEKAKIQSNINISDASPIAFILIAALSGAVSLIYGKLKEQSYLRKKVQCKLSAFGSETEITLLSDSGNLLCDPFTKKPVIVLSAKLSERFLPLSIIRTASNKDVLSAKEDGLKVRLIPICSVHGSGMLVGFVPESVEIEGRKVDAVVALDTAGDGYDGCEGIVPVTLLIT